MSALDPDESTAAELRRILEVYAPGRRVADVGRAVGALPGFDVTGIPPDTVWPVSTVDAVVCLCWAELGWADRRRLLQGARGYLADRGLIVIDHASPELLSFVREAGFTVLRTEAVGVRLVARARPSVNRSLAVAHWGTPAAVRLDLRYAPDEDEWLRPRPKHLWESLIGEAPHAGADLVSAYPVDDPYGGERGAPVVSRFFDIPVAPGQLTFGAGVTSLLHALAGLGGEGPVLAPTLVHPDLAAWALARGREVRLVSEPATYDRIHHAIAEVRPALLHLDRPDFAGDALSLDEVRALADVVSLAGGVVLIDEAPAAYLGPAGSAARLVPHARNLVVLRGFTKAYSWGGLRCGFALAGEGVAGRVRDSVPPMQVGELALHAALRMLAAGDVLAELRHRIHKVKPDFAGALTAMGLHVIAGHPDVPWVVVSDTGGAASRLLDGAGVQGLSPVPPPVVPSPAIDLLHLTVPLSDERIALFRELIST
jgi:histidinol-phosphate/aromatic aminotransferase/cobyric acid decarboxylase-like protein